MLDNEVLEKLKQPLEASRVKHRQGGGGMSLAYLKGHNVIDQANEVFGHGAWGYDILLVELCNVVAENGEIIGGYYAARVRLTVQDCIPITEEGVCPIQEGRNPRAKIDAHDMARKGAVTDAMKRAFRCYGDQFGNSLYDTDLVDGQPGTEKGQPNKPAQAASQPTAPQRQQAAQPTNRPAPSQPPVARPVSTPAPARPVTQPTSTPNVVGNGGPLASEQQVQAIVRLAGRQGMDEIERDKKLRELYGHVLNEISNDEARHFIKVLQEV